MALNCVPDTCVHLVTDGIRSRMAACTAGERPQMPSPCGNMLPSTPRFAPPASAAWPSPAAALSDTPTIVPPFSARLFATRSTPFPSLSPDATR